MTRDWIFVPVIVQVLLTLAIYVRLIKVKIRELRAGLVNRERLPLYEDAWPASVLQINNNIRNQFELPVLFYVLCLALYVTDGVTALQLGLAWTFVALRCVHSLVHVTYNKVMHRFRAYALGLVVLMAMWITFALNLAG
jgi:hypothetical protein